MVSKLHVEPLDQSPPSRAMSEPCADEHCLERWIGWRGAVSPRVDPTDPARWNQTEKKKNGEARQAWTSIGQAGGFPPTQSPKARLDGSVADNAHAVGPEWDRLAPASAHILSRESDETRK